MRWSKMGLSPRRGQWAGINPSLETVCIRTRVVYWLSKGLRKRAHSLFVPLPPWGGRGANSPCLNRGGSPLRQALSAFKPVE